MEATAQQQTTLDRIIERRMESRIQEAILDLTERRDAFVQHANREVAAFNGGIQALQGLLGPPAPPDMTNRTEGAG